MGGGEGGEGEGIQESVKEEGWEEGWEEGMRGEEGMDKGGQICEVCGISTPHVHQLHMYINSTCTSTPHVDQLYMYINSTCTSTGMEVP